ncbi:MULTISPECIES: Ppx/GppA phosphatase family protein [unclassified Minwuia]|uniref:Ppx/GppA phosphatase family protein n=1 Tax=unclassified Minwuia TaxID=2618799 RepID=UPI002478A52B|nr:MULTISPECIES: Ppx/GppA phosphatase family protein [unclassified Minwuia]
MSGGVFDRRRERCYAAVDLGTNNCRLLIAQPSGDSFRVVDAYSRIVRLGEGVAASGHLHEAAIDRTIDALKICADKIARRGVWDLRCVATAACRAAGNAEGFVDRVRRETGLRIDVIDAEEEATLALSGCMSLLSGHEGPALVFDIGGGSTEFALAQPHEGRSHRLSRFATFPVGVVNFAEDFGGDIVDDETYAAMVARAREIFSGFANSVASDFDLNALKLVGTSGTVTTLAGVFLNLVRYDRAAVDGLSIPSRRMTEISGHLQRLSLTERAEHPCVGPGRADLVIGGCAILQAILDLWPVPDITVADRGLREGILLRLMREDAALMAAGD